MAISKEKKRELVADYGEKLARSRGVIFTDYSGLSVKQQEVLRSQLAELDSTFQVIKNSLLELALEGAGMSVPSQALQGPTAIGYAYADVPALVKVLADFAKQTELLPFKGGLLGDRFIAAQDVQALADLPPREVLLARVVGGMQAPISGLVNVLSGTMRGFLNVLTARADQLETAAS